MLFVPKSDFLIIYFILYVEYAFSDAFMEKRWMDARYSLMAYVLL